MSIQYNLDSLAFHLSNATFFSERILITDTEYWSFFKKFFFCFDLLKAARLLTTWFSHKTRTIFCSSGQTPNSETTNPEVFSKNLFFCFDLLKAARLLTTWLVWKWLWFSHKTRTIFYSSDETPNPETTNHEVF